MSKSPPVSDNGNQTVILEEGIPIQETKSYGIGIDCHKLFIQVCVIVKRDKEFFAHQKDFNTDWESLLDAKNWIFTILSTQTNPVPDLSAPLHYCLESTSTYHMPVILAFEGCPSIINPTIAGSTKRKTDVLDARLLATHDLIGVWKESYLPSKDVNELRVLLAERDRCIKEATAASRRINNILVRFGITVGRSGSVSKDGTVRDLVAQILDGEVDLPKSVCPIGIPYEVRAVIISEYQKYDDQMALADSWKEKAISKVYSMEWETQTGTLPGKQMMKLLTTAPQIGELTAVFWLAYIITPRRFPNAKALAAYCGLDPSLKISARHVTSTVKRGGCKQLHAMLASAGNRLVRNHNEMFGQWGFNLYNSSGKWKKAINAVARKLAVSLYFMMRTGSAFSYEHYHLVDTMKIPDIPVTELPSIEPDFKRYIRILQEHGIQSTSQLVDAYLSCTLGSCRGLGKKFFTTLRIFLNNPDKYKKAYHTFHQSSETEEINNGQNHEQ